jgi:tRNA dimethylallyltransferase
MEIARRVGAVIFSVDSMQAYRGMDIGTAKPSSADRREVPHELIDIADPEVDLTVPVFQRLAAERIETYDRPILVVGGSGLHFRSIVDPLTFAPHDPEVRAGIEQLEEAVAVDRLVEADPAAGRHVDLRNPRRVTRALEVFELTGMGPSARAERPEAVAVREYRPLRPFVGIGVDPGDDISERVTARVEVMMDAGLMDEVTGLAPRLGRNASQAVGYAELLEVIAGKATLGEAIEAIATNTMKLVRRQRTWFRRDPRVTWLTPDIDTESAVAYCLDRWMPRPPS